MIVKNWIFWTFFHRATEGIGLMFGYINWIQPYYNLKDLKLVIVSLSALKAYSQSLTNHVQGVFLLVQ